MQAIWTQVLDFPRAHPGWVGSIAGLSLLLFLGSLLLIPWMVCRLPADYFHSPHHLPLEHWRHKPRSRLALLLLKNCCGGFLFLAGLAMLVLPGQGLLTMLMGLMLIDFPKKHRLKRRVVAWPPLFRVLNKLREKRGLSPFVA
jgi:hypothetical protein